MDIKDKVLNKARTQVGRSLYVWGARGQNILEKSDPEEWVRSMESAESREQNVQRVMRRLAKLKAQGIDPILCFDCSGFIFWLFSAFGLIKTRTNAAGLFRQCEKKDRDGLKAGDLVFVHNGSRVTHVGLYAGDGMAIHSKGRDAGVVEEKLSAHGWNRYGRWPGMYEDDPEPAGELHVLAKGTVHIRSGPGTQYERIGTSKKGETFPLIETRDGWHRIEYREHPEAWITAKTKYTEVIEE